MILLTDRESDLTIARRLLSDKRITTKAFDAWYLHNQGASIFSLRGQFRRESGPVHASTVYRWVQRVNEAIREERAANPQELVRYGCTIASGSRTRHAGDPTAQLRVVTEQSNWPNEDSLRAVGELDRWSRKR